MRLKYSLLVLALLSTSSFSNCTAWGPMALDPAYSPNPSGPNCNAETYQVGVSYGASIVTTNWACQTPSSNKHYKLVNNINRTGPFAYPAGNFYFQQECFTTSRYINVSSCSPGYFPNADNVCALPDLSLYNGDRIACQEHGGWTIEGKCVTEATFKTEIKQNKVDYVVGSFLKIGGALLTAAGLIAAPITSVPYIVSSGIISNGVMSYLSGAWWLAGVEEYYSDNAGDMAGTGSALSTGGKTFKLDLLNYDPSNPTTPPDPTKPSGQVVVKTDEATGRVEGATFVPDRVIEQMKDPSKVDFVNDTRTEPMDMTGSVESTFEYENNTVTTKTYISPTEIKTEVSPITVTQNPDGTITATPPASSTAPAVSGSSGGSWDHSAFLDKISKNYDETTAYHEALVKSIADGTPRPELNTTKTDPVEQSGANIVSKLDQILNAITGGSAPALSDGSNGFGALDTQVKGSYSGFIYTDPLGLNALGGGSIPSYGFTLYGRHFTIMDQAKLDALPLDAIRGLFLFIAAIAAFLTVISGV